MISLIHILAPILTNKLKVPYEGIDMMVTEYVDSIDTPKDIDAYYDLVIKTW